MNNNNKFIDESLAEFDGNDNLLNFDSQTNTTTNATIPAKNVDDLMNENNLLMDQQVASKGFDNEFGPETDVDAVDEAMLMSSPHSVSQEEDDVQMMALGKEFQQFEQKEVDFTESPAKMMEAAELMDQFIEPEFKSAAEHEYESFLKHTSGHFGEPQEPEEQFGDEPEAQQRNMFGLPKEVLGGGDDEAENGEWMSYFDLVFHYSLARGIARYWICILI